MGAVSGIRADAAHAHQTHRRTADLAQALDRPPSAFACLQCILVEASSQREQQSDDGFRNRRRVHALHVGQHHGALHQFRPKDSFHARGRVLNPLELARGGELFAGKAAKDGVGVGQLAAKFLVPITELQLDRARKPANVFFGGFRDSVGLYPRVGFHRHRSARAGRGDSAVGGERIRQGGERRAGRAGGDVAEEFPSRGIFQGHDLNLLPGMPGSLSPDLSARYPNRGLTAPQRHFDLPL